MEPPSFVPSGYAFLGIPLSTLVAAVWRGEETVGCPPASSVPSPKHQPRQRHDKGIGRFTRRSLLLVGMLNAPLDNSIAFSTVWLAKPVTFTSYLTCDLLFIVDGMAPKNAGPEKASNKSKSGPVGKGKSRTKDDEASSPKLKAANSINARHILVRRSLDCSSTFV